MKLSPKLLCSVLLSTTVFFFGCTKSPVRPTADVTSTTSDDTPRQPQPPDPGPPIFTDPKNGLQPNDGVIETADMIRGKFQPIYFDLDKSAIKLSERDKLKDVMKYLADHPDYRILLEGHCDWRGTAEYNLGLGDRRAIAVKNFLVQTKIPVAKLETLSKGSLDSAEKGSDDQMAKDRRVDVVVLKK